MIPEKTYTAVECSALLKKHNCCVLIPTYNNEDTLARVIEEVRGYCNDIIVVDDGSTDATPDILSTIADISVHTIQQNTGKGYALRTGIRKAAASGYAYAISIDSDGQHMASDLAVFAAALNEHRDALIIGARNMSQKGIPSTSSFGNRFSNFWFWVETGMFLPDTQSGYRLYPLRRLGKMRYVTRRYEFEIEVLVRAAWAGVAIESIPVQVYYAPKETRISHFRPFRDFGRVSLLNTVLVIIALLFVRPFRFIRSLNPRNIRTFFEKELWKSKDSDGKITASVMLGLFMGVAPVWGWQMALALLLAIVLKLNRVITLVASNISIPPMIPFIVWGSYAAGSLVYIREKTPEFSSELSLNNIWDNVLQYAVGSIILGLILAAVGGLATFVLLKVFRKKKSRALQNNSELHGI